MSYSQFWVTALSDEEKKSIGITWEDVPAPFDDRYYYSAGKPRPLENGKDSDGTEFYGIRPVILENQKITAGQLLAKTDWYVTRKAETGTAVPDTVTTYRAAVRTACAEREKEIAAVSSTADLEKLMEAPATIDGKANPDALTQWPTEPS